MSITDIITRQFNIANDEQYDLGLPKQKIYAMCNLIKQGKASEGWYVIFIDKDTYIFSLRDICKYLSSLQKQGIQPFHSGHFTRTTVGDQTTVTKQMCELPITLAKHYELH